MKGDYEVIRTLWKLGTHFKFKKRQRVWVEVQEGQDSAFHKILGLPREPWKGIIAVVYRKGLLVKLGNLNGRMLYFRLREVYPSRLEDL